MIPRNLQQFMVKQAYGYSDEHNIGERFDPLYYDYASHDPSYAEKGVTTAAKFDNLRKSLKQFSSHVSGIHPDLRLRFSPSRYYDDPQHTAEEMIEVINNLEQRSKDKDWDWEDTESYEEDFPYFYNVENRGSDGWLFKKPPPKITHMPDKVMIALQAAFKGEAPDYSVLDNLEEEGGEPLPWTWESEPHLADLVEDVTAARKDPDLWDAPDNATNEWYDSNRGEEATDKYYNQYAAKSSSLSSNLQQFMVKQSGILDYFNSAEGQSAGLGALGGMLTGGVLGATGTLTPYVGDNDYAQTMAGSAAGMGLLGAGIGGLGGWGAKKLFGNGPEANPDEVFEYADGRGTVSLDEIRDMLRKMPSDHYGSEYTLPVTEEGLTAIGDDQGKLLDWLNWGSPNASQMIDDSSLKFFERMEKEFGEEKAFDIWQRSQDIAHDDPEGRLPGKYIAPEELTRFIDQYDQALHEAAVSSKNRGYS